MLRYVTDDGFLGGIEGHTNHSIWHIVGVPHDFLAARPLLCIRQSR